MSTTFEDLSSDLTRDIEERNRRIEESRLKAAQQMGYDEGLSRRVLNAAEFTGMPPEVVASDLENIESQIKARSFDVESYRKSSPEWTRFLSENPYHMAALERDTENMGYVSRSLKQIGLGWKSTWDQVEMAQLQNMRIRQGGEFTPEQQELHDKLQQTQVDHEFGAEGLLGFFVKNVKMLGPTLHSMRQGLEYGGYGALSGMGAAAIAGQAGPQVATPEEILTVPAAGVIGFKAGMAAGSSEAAYELERGFAYSEYRDMGLDHETAKMAASTVGAINSTLEAVSIGVAVRHIPWLRAGSQAVAKKLTADVLTKPTIARATGTAVLRFGEVLGTEVVTESVQESVTFWAGEIAKPDAYGTGIPSYDRWTDRVAETALEVMQGAFLISTLGPGMSYYSDLRRAHQAGQTQKIWETVARGASKSETHKNNRGAYQAFVQRLVDQGAAENVWIDADRLVTYFQEKGRDPKAVAAELGIDAADFQEAVELGTDIAIPTLQFADKIAPTAAGMDLAADLKGSQDAMSAREAEIWRANNPKIVEQIEKMSAETQDTATTAKIEQIVQDVTGQLVSAGYSTGAAGKLAQIMRGIGVLAERMNMDPTGLYEKVFGGVKRVTPQAQAATENVDVLIDPLLNRIRDRNFPSQREMFGPSLIDFINESGGIDLTDAELEAMDFELAAKELGVSQAKLNRWKKEGREVSAIAEIAAEQGYIASADEKLLLEALRRETMGEPVYSSQEAGDSGLRDLSIKLDELATFIEQAGLDIDHMTNEEVREALAKRDTFLQADTEEIRALTEIILQQVLTAEETAQLQEPFTGGQDVDTKLARAAAMLPMVSEQQSFGDVTISDTVRIDETGKRAKVKVPAQRKFDRAVKRKNVIKRLLDCVSG